MQNFTPKNTEGRLFILSDDNYTLQDILDQAKEHFGSRFDPAKLKISAVHLHCRCLGYDRYDSSDFDEYIIIDLE